MSGPMQAFLVGGALLGVAGLVAWLTWRARRSPVVWMRHTHGSLAHAIHRTELAGQAHEVNSARNCGPWLAADLVRDHKAERCAACTSAVTAQNRGIPMSRCPAL